MTVPSLKIMRKLWSNTSERTQGDEEEQGEYSSYSKSIDVLLRETARKHYPVLENVNNPMIAPQDYDVRQSGRVLELHNRVLWIRPTDLSWHLPEHQRRSQEWSPDEARVRSDWQSADWDRSNAQQHYMAVTSLLGNEVIYIDPLNNGNHGDENNVCLSRTNTFATTATCPSDVTCDI